MSQVPSVPMIALDTLWFQVAGTLCNIACTHCFISSSPTNRSHGMLSIEEVERYLEQARALGVREYYFTGGEPFLNRDLLKILQITLAQGPVTVLTNGMLLRSDVCRDLRRLFDESEYSLDLRVSLDGFDRETHDAIRGAGVWDRVMMGLRNLAEVDLKCRTAGWGCLDCKRRLADAMIEWFWDDEVGAFFDTAKDAERLITRPRDVTDNATPSGTSLAVELLLHLSELNQDAEYRRRAVFTLETLVEPVTRFPTAFGHLLGCAAMEINGAIEVALVGDVKSVAFRALERAVAEQYVPSLVLAGGAAGKSSRVQLLADRPLVGGRPTAYVCRAYTCDKPVTEPDALSDQLESAARVGATV